jgi:hypothetical protein
MEGNAPRMLAATSYQSGVQMLPSFLRSLGFGKEPPLAEPETTQWSDHLKDVQAESWESVKNASLSVPDAAPSGSLDGSSDEYEDVRVLHHLCLILKAHTTQES